jgi:hypothetical protein
LGAVYAAIALSDSIRAIFMDSYRFAVVPGALQGPRVAQRAKPK